MNRKNQAGLTIVELIVVIGVIALSLPVIFNLFFTMLRAQAKTYALQEVKRNGDTVLNLMQTLVRQRAIGIYSDQALTTEICAASGSQSGGPLYFKDRAAALFYFASEGANPAKIASRTATLVYYNLTNPKVTVNNFSLQCFRRSAFSPPAVKIDFDIVSFSTFATRQEEKAKIHYTTQVKLRN